MGSVSLEAIRDICQIVYFVALSITGPVALIGYLAAKNKERQQREDGTYDSLDVRYLDYQKLCLSYSELDVFDIAREPSRPLTEQDKKQELILFTILISIFERAYLMYRGHTETSREKQWSGWVEYMEGFAKRPNFRKAWEICGPMFDTDFCEFMAGKMNSP